MSRYWCGVVSREHIKRGEAGGFCQVCHGKRGPLERMAVGDGIVFYSPSLQFRGAEKCQRFTAIGKVVGQDTYSFEMEPGFVPFRRDVDYFKAEETAIQPLLGELEFTRGKTSWGYKFRFGHFELSEADFLLIARHMLPDDWSRRFQVSGEAKAVKPTKGQQSLFDAPVKIRRAKATA